MLLLLVDVFEYLSVIVHALVIMAQSMAIGGSIFLVFLARPFAARLTVPVAAYGAVQVFDGAGLARRTARLTAWSAVALIVAQGLTVAMQLAVVKEAVGLDLGQILGANFVVAGLIKIVAALLLALLLFAGNTARGPLLALCVIILGGAVMTTHSVARLDDRGILMVATTLHLLGAAVWIGGIPAFILALSRIRDGASLRLVGARFSRLSMIGVGCILVSATIFSVYYIGALNGLYSTAYGVMVTGKGVLFLMLLGLGFGNFLVVERLRRDPKTSVLRLRRFAEVEIGIGLTLFFAAASLTSTAPAVDIQPQDRVSTSEIVERFSPRWPSLVEPDHSTLTMPPADFVPGSGEVYGHELTDSQLSEFGHHRAGVFVLVIALLALLDRMGVRWARHWPLGFLVLGVFLMFVSEPEVWPLGPVGFFASLRDVEVLQHKAVFTLVIAFALFEWGVNIGTIKDKRAALVFPLLVGVGSILLLAHSHPIIDIKDQLLVEMTHTPMALLGVTVASARWLQLRTDGRVAQIASWVWPTGLLLISIILLLYRET